MLSEYDGLLVKAVLLVLQSTGSIPRSSFNNFFWLSLDEMFLK